MKNKVLIVEDDIDLGNLLKQYLEINDFYAQRVFNGEEARQELKINTYDILVLDVMMPKEDGFTLAKKIVQSHPELPFLFVTAKKMKDDVLQGLSIGADDYMIKPFDADELILRVKNILKRTQHQIEQVPENIMIGAYSFSPENLTLVSPQTKKVLTEKEAKLLYYLCRHPNQLIKRKSILDHLWDDADFFNGRSMDVFISKLRKYLAEDPEIRIDSIRGVGIMFTFP